MERMRTGRAGGVVSQMIDGNPQRRTPDSEVAAGRACVVLLHGLAAHSCLMLPLRIRLQKEGYWTVNWTYPSLQGGVHDHAQRLARLLNRLAEHPEISQLHIVAHSMGSIITRVVLENLQCPKLDHVILMGPPNRGSHVATRMARLLARWCPALHELADEPTSLVNQLCEPCNTSMGILAAKHDRLVEEQATRLPSIVEHRVIDAGHNEMLLRRETAEHVVHFLRNGTFDHEPLRRSER